LTSASTVALVTLLLAASCSLDTGAISDSDRGDTGSGSDTGAPIDSGADTRWTDTGPARDTGVTMDSSPMDTSPADSGPADTGPPDAGMPDTRPPDTGRPDTGPPPTCNSQYGSRVTGYFLCEETPTSCEFYTNPPGNQSCNMVCTAGGGTCLDAWRELGVCGHNEDRACENVMNDMICLCSRGPGP